MSFLRLGMVSNVWAPLLPGTGIEALCAEAARRGYTHVELRQGALGEAERADGPDQAPRPDPDRLSRLAGSQPGLRFNLALAIPLFGETELDEALIGAGLESARGLGGAPPLLRLVDPAPLRERPSPAAFAATVRRLTGLAGRAAAVGVLLAVEHASQPLTLVRQLLEIAREQVGPEWAPRLCWDPANMLTASLPPEDPRAAIRSLPSDMLALFHFKQVRDGTVQPVVQDGEIDWGFLLQALRHKAYEGPALFEIPPSPDAWAHLERSRDYITGIVTELPPAGS